MKKFAINYNELESDLKEKPKVFKLSDVKDKITKVAFDVVKFNDSEGLEGLWQVKETDEGEYIVATYETEELSSESQTNESSWKAVASADKVHVFYKDTPVAKIAAASVGVPAEETPSLAKTLNEKLGSDDKLTKSLLKELSKEDRKELLATYPELQE